MLTDITIKSRVHVPTILNLIGAIYPRSLNVLDELGDNGLDAGADKMWIVLEPDRISFIDNGEGMLPDVPKPDRKIIDDFLQKGDDSSVDLRSRVSPLAMKSLTWMVELAGLSPRALQKGKRGVHGIGAIAPRLIADEIVWHTRPSMDLAREYWREASINSDPPTFTLRVPTAQQLARGNVSNTIKRADKPLADPFGNKLLHGTCVEMTMLREDFSPADVISSLSKRFGNDIRSKGVEIVVVNKKTPEAIKRGGVSTVVEPADYPGIGLIFTRGHHKDGDHPFEINLFYKPDGKGLEPQIMREGAPAGFLSSIHELKGTLLCTSGKISGYIEFSAPSSEAPWTAQKDRPKPSDRLKQWIESVLRYTRDLQEKIDEIEDKRRRHEESLRTELVESALKEALRQIPTFKHVSLFLPAPVERKKRKRSKVKAKENLNSIVSIRDQYRRPVRSVSFKVTKNGLPFGTGTFTPGLSGTRSLGILEKGRYSVTLVDEKRPYEPKMSKFEINDSNPRVNVVFTIRVPGPQPEDKRISGLRIWAHDLGDPGMPYSINQLRTGFSTVEINNQTFDFQEARDLNDVEAQTRLKVLYTAMALAEFSFPLEPSAYQMAQAATLFNRAMSKVQALTPKKRRSHK